VDRNIILFIQQKFLGESKIAYFVLRVMPQNVSRLDISVHNALGVHFLNRNSNYGDAIDDLLNDENRLFLGESSSCLELILQGSLVAILHNEDLDVLIDKNVIALDDMRAITSCHHQVFSLAQSSLNFFYFWIYFPVDLA